MRPIPILTALALALPSLTPMSAQVADSLRRAESVTAITPPLRPLPAEAASAAETRFSFIVYGDTRGRRDGVQEQYEHSLIVDEMLRTMAAKSSSPYPVRFVLQSGDAVVDGRDARQWNRSYVGLINRITGEGGVPYFIAPGNHDVTSTADLNADGRQNALRNYLAAIGRLIPPNGATRRLAGYPTFGFGFGNMFVLAFDSNIAEDSTQFAWIQAQLESLDRRRYKHVVAFFHHPVFSSGPHGGPTVERPTAVLREKFMPLFRRHRVRLLFAGHEHFFEHWVERWRDSAGRTQRLDQIVSGGGGAPLYGFRGIPDLRAYLTAGRPDGVRLEHLARPGLEPGDNAYHFVVVHVDGERLWVDVVGVDWGRAFRPYRSARAVLGDSSASR